MPRYTTPSTPSSGGKPYDRLAIAQTPVSTKDKGSSDISDSDSDFEDKRDIKPDVDSHYNADDKPKKKKNGSTTGRKASPTKAPGRPWTGPELVRLFEIAADGVKRADYTDKLPGRTDMQALKTWQNTVVPFIKKALEEKGSGKR